MTHGSDDANELESVLESMDDGVIALTDKARIETANRAARQLLSLPEDAVGRPLRRLVSVPELHDLVGRAQQGEAGAVEFGLPGSARFIHARATHQYDGGFVVVMRDVTEIRRLETIRRDFVANVSHELRTPVSIIRANAETLLDGALAKPDQARRFVEALHRNAERLGRLISDLLDISRIEAGKYPVSATPTALASLVRRVSEVVEARIESGEVELVVDIDDGLRVLADTKALEQVMLNLIENAVKYSSPKGRVEVHAKVEGNITRIEVRDDGPGIDAVHRPRIFERFYRVDTGRSREMGGTGLGLAIVKHLVEVMRGRVGVAPREPQGTIFWVTLPTSPET